MRFTCCPNLIFILLPLGKSKLNLLLLFSDFRQVTVILLRLGNTLGYRKQSKPTLIKNSKTTHRIWYKSFSMIQSARVKNWVPQSIRFIRSPLDTKAPGPPLIYLVGPWAISEPHINICIRPPNNCVALKQFNLLPQHFVLKQFLLLPPNTSVWSNWS